jgi:hypothetical protein
MALSHKKYEVVVRFIMHQDHPEMDTSEHNHPMTFEKYIKYAMEMVTGYDFADSSEIITIKRIKKEDKK